MAYVQFNRKPFEGTFSNLVDDLFTELPLMLNNGFNNSVRKDSVPVTVKETEGSYELEVVAPGFEKSDFKVNLEQQLLTVSAEKQATEKPATEKQIRKEYSFRSFKRSFTLDDKIDATKIEASYINGILRLNLPKQTTVKASQAIEIK
jgi:HSP20 family protein